jgi:PAS domain S-box-containing protein
MDNSKTKEQLLIEINQLKEKVDHLEKSKVDFQRMEEQYKKADLKSSLWLDSSPVCTKILDLDFNLQYMSSAGIKALKIEDVTEYYGKPYPFYFFSESSKSSIINSLNKVKETGITTIAEMAITDTQGGELWFQATIVPVYKKNNELDYIMVFSVNQTERNQIEIELRENEEKYKALFVNAPLSYQSLNEDGIIIDVNPTWLKTLGYSSKDVIGRSFESFLHDDWKPHFTINFPEFKKKGSIEGVQFKIEHKDGHFLDIAFDGCVGSNLDGSFKQTYCVFKDITEQKEVELALQESKERYDSSMAASKDGIFDWNLIDNTIYYSPGWKSMLGYEVDELPNDFSVWENLTEPEHAKKSWVMQNELINKQRDRFEMEFKMKHKDGHWIDILSRAEAIFDKSGKAVRMVGTHVDITERKQSEELLRENEIFLKQTQEISNVGGWSYDVATGESKFTAETYKIHGLPMGHIPTTEDGMKHYHPDDREIILDAFSKIIDEGKPYDLEVRFINAQGKNLFVRTSGRPIIDNGKVVKVIGTLVDITKKKREEEELKEHRNHLEELVKERTAELEEKNHELDQALKVFVGREYKINKLQERIRELEGTKL